MHVWANAIRLEKVLWIWIGSKWVFHLFDSPILHCQSLLAEIYGLVCVCVSSWMLVQKWSVLFPVRVQMRIWIRALCSVALMLSHTISSHMLNFLSLHIYLVGICRITYSLFCLCVLYRSFTIFPCSIHISFIIYAHQVAAVFFCFLSISRSPPPPPPSLGQNCFN